MSRSNRPLWLSRTDSIRVFHGNIAPCLTPVLSRVDGFMPDSSQLQDVADAYKTAIRLLSRREHSCYELSRKLKSRGIHQEIIVQTISSLTQEGLISDARFTESYVRVRIGKGFGPLRIRSELGELGIQDEMIAQYMEHDEEFWLESAMTARIKRFGEDQPEDTKAWSKQARFLQQRGFNTSIVRKILGNCYT